MKRHNRHVISPICQANDVLKTCQVSSQEREYFSRCKGGGGTLRPHPQAQKLKKSPGEIGLIQVVFKWLPLSELLLLTKFPGWDEENLTIPYHPTEEGEVIILSASSLCATNIKISRRKVWANMMTHKNFCSWFIVA